MTDARVATRPFELFGLGPLEFDDDGTVFGSTPTGPWLCDATGDVLPGAIGVLIDAVLGHAIDRVAGKWSVTSQLDMHMVLPIPTDQSVFVRARSVSVQDGVGTARGEVSGGAGRALGYVHGRGRFVEEPSGRPWPTSGAEAASTGAGVPPTATSLVALLGSVRTCGGLSLELDVTPGLANPFGNLHGGISVCLTDMLASVADPGPKSTTSLQIHFLRPAPLGKTLRAQAVIAHQGRSRSVLHVTALVDGKPHTVATVVRE